MIAVSKGLIHFHPRALVVLSHQIRTVSDKVWNPLFQARCLNVAADGPLSSFFLILSQRTQSARIQTSTLLCKTQKVAVVLSALRLVTVPCLYLKIAAAPDNA